jgi:hypothetical protein
LDDPSALCFASLVCDDGDFLNEVRLKRAAALGHPLAQAIVSARYTPDKLDALALATKSMMQGEREGFVQMGRCLLKMRDRKSRGSDQALVDQALLKFLEASDLGSVYATEKIAEFTNDLLDKYFWLGKAAAQSKDASRFMEMLSSQLFHLDVQPREIFAFGRALHGHVSVEEHKIFGDDCDFERRALLAIYAVQFFCLQTESARSAVLTWTLIAKRLLVVKDVRLIIARLIWLDRGGKL